MLIRKLHIQRYRNLRQFEQSFDRGLNLVLGRNESGKSVLIEALLDLFYLDPKTNRKEIAARQCWNADQAPVITAEFESDGAAYRLQKDFEAGETILWKVHSGEEIRDRRRIQEIIESCLGLANRGIYLATAAVRENEADLVSRSPEAIKDKLEALITGAREEVLASQVLSKAETLLQELNSADSKTPGLVQKAMHTKEELIYELDKAKREIDQIGKNRLKVKEVQALAANLGREYEAKKAHAEKAAVAAQVEERVSALEDRYQNLSGRVKAIQNSESVVTRLKEELSELPKIEQTDLTIAEEQSAQVRYLENKRETVGRSVDEQSERLALAKPDPFLRLSTVFVLGLTLGLAAWYYFLTHAKDTRLLIGAAAGTVLFIILTMFWSSKARAAAAIRLQYNLKKAALDEIRSDLESARVSVEAILDKYRVRDVTALKNKFEAYRDLEREIKSEVLRYEGWLGEKTLKELELELKSVTRELAVENESARDLRIYCLSPEDQDKLRSTVEDLEKQRATFEATEVSVMRQLEFAESGSELQASLEERLEEIESSIQHALRQEQLYQTCREFVDRARKNVLKASLAVLEEHTSQILGQITGGRYSQVRFDRQTLKFAVFCTEVSDWVDPDTALSMAARDQLYLAARLALVKIISQERTPILILDEPLLTYDPERREQALALLRQFSSTYQILVFSCHDCYRSAADLVITLDSPRQIPQPTTA